MADVKRLSGSAMRILYVLLAIIQFSFAFHAVKSGRGAMWVTIIIVFPVAGPPRLLLHGSVPGLARGAGAAPARARHRQGAQSGRRAASGAPRNSRRPRASRIKRASSPTSASSAACSTRRSALYDGCLDGAARQRSGDPLLAARGPASTTARCAHAQEVLVASSRRRIPKYRPGRRLILMRARVHEGAGREACARSKATKHFGIATWASRPSTAMPCSSSASAGTPRLRSSSTTSSKNARRSALESEQQWVKLAAQARDKAAA